MENKVLTQEEIQSLKTIQTNQSNLVQSLGTVEYRIQLLELDKQTLSKYGLTCAKKLFLVAAVFCSNTKF